MKNMLSLVKMLIISIMIALFISFFQYFSHEIVHYSEELLKYNNIIFILIIILTVLLSFVLINVNKKYPGYLGSGIPQFEAYFDHGFQFSGIKMLILVTINSFFAYFSGFLLGGEGPSISTSGALAKITNDVCKDEDRELVEAASSAGFACAFLSPLAGVCHLIEENKKHLNFSLIFKGVFIIFLSTVLGYLIYPHSLLPNVANDYLPYNLYFLLIFVALFVIAFSYLFKRSILLVKDLNKKYNFMVYLTPLLVIVFMLLRKYYPLLVGSGGIILSTSIYDLNLFLLAFLLVFRLIMSAISANANVSGGMVLPMLAIGAILGEIVTNIFVMFYPNLGLYSEVLKICAMVGVFAVVTNCPFTALVLGLKMGKFSVMILPLTIVIGICFIFLKAFKQESIYKGLVRRLLN